MTGGCSNFHFMRVSEQKDLVQSLRAEWGLQLPELVSEEEILQQLERKVIELADRNPESFFQLMYRLDIPEQKVKLVLFEPDAAAQIAGLIYKRQLQKIEVRKMFHRHDYDIDDELKW